MSRRLLINLIAAVVAISSATAASRTALGDSSERWGLVDISVACIRTAPAHSSELATQALCGTPLRVDADSGEWRKVTLPDGYEGFVNSSSIVELTPEQFSAWRKSQRLIVTAPGQITVVADTLAEGARNAVSDLIGGCIVEALGRGDSWQEIAMPNGRRGFIPADASDNLLAVSHRGFSAEKVLSTAYAMTGTPYLWGGTSAKSPDCSGLVKCCWLACGIIVPRDASQQALVGNEVDPDDSASWQLADLLFFTNAAGRVTHVAIYDTDGIFVHSSGRVRRSHVDPDHKDYDGRSPVIVRRYADAVGQPGIISVHNHPWYTE